MYLSLIQFAPVFGNKKLNLEKIHTFIDSTNSDIIVFPELAITGYDFKDRDEVLKYADDFNGSIMQDLAEKAEQQHKTIIVGFAEKADNGKKLFNSAAAFFPNKELNCVYRKTHLFFRERFCFDEGNTGFFNIHDEYRDINIGLMICYDWRFPEAARTLAIKGADLIVCPSNLVTNVWDISTKSRALENKVYLAVANRTGTENRNGNELLFNGKSVIYKFNSEEIAKASSSQEQVITAEINPQNTRNKSFNEYNDIFSDRRPEFYI